VCEEDFEPFFRREMASLVAFVRRAGFDGEQALDAAQEAMTSAYQQWLGLKHPRAWIRTVAYRTALNDAVRTRQGVLRAVAGGWTTSEQSGRHDPDVAVLAAEHEQLLLALGKLSPCQRQVMTWHLDGFTHSEIADELRMSPATVRSNLRHARVALKAQFDGRAEREEA
jgi:RNA polymerase sigma-70 factor (ECF subfamily)